MRRTGILVAVIFFIGSMACVKVGEMREESLDVELESLESLEVEIRLGAGELSLSGGAEKLMEGSFAYNVRRWKPVLDYHVWGNRGVLLIKQRRSSGIPLGKARNRWDIRLSNKVPVELQVDFGAGEGDIDLRGMKLESVSLDVGVGDLELDLSGEIWKDLDVTLDGGVGSATIYLPENAGVRVRVDGGIGSVDAVGFRKSGNTYTNDRYEDSKHKIVMNIDAGIGSVDLRLK